MRPMMQQVDKRQQMRQNGKKIDETKRKGTQRNEKRHEEIRRKMGNEIREDFRGNE